LKSTDLEINCTKIAEMKQTKALSRDEYKIKTQWMFGRWNTWNWKGVQVPLMGDVTRVL